MMLPPTFFTPFDITYQVVTDRMRAVASELNADEQDWVATLINEFQAERALWHNKQELTGYGNSCTRLRVRLLQLAACAYLHVAYDLPRLIADNWPGLDEWSEGPNEFRAEQLYFRLGSAFPYAVTTVAGDRKVLGLPSFVWRIAPGGLRLSATYGVSHWVGHLRMAAWIHARRLAHEPHLRERREQLMLIAMTAALAHVSNLRPWTAGLLYPPNLGAMAVLPLSLAELDQAWVGAAAASMMLLSAGTLIALGFRRELELRSFVDAFGQRVYEYTAAAIELPEGFFDYLRRRETEDAEGYRI